MKLNELQNNLGAKEQKRIVGRGPGSGLGKTSGRGQKGQKSRSGGGVNPVFEGGQLPLYRRIPARGFNNAIFRKEYAIINLSDLNHFDDNTVITPELLKELGIVKKQLSGIKILGTGELTKKLTIKAHKFSQSAIDKITAAGSKYEVI